MTITKKRENAQDKVNEAFQLIKEGINNLTSSDKYIEFLAFTSRFYNYSLNNQLLIWAQKPNATFVAGFKAWQKMGRYVKKGEKGIKILAPMHIKIKKNNDNGEEEVVEFNRYRTVSVFDISQTKGENQQIPSLNDFVKTVSGETELYEMMKEISPFPVSELEDCDGADGYFILKTKEIKICSKNPTSHRLLTLIHEMAHGLLHGDRKTSPTKQIREIEAEAVGFVVCHTLNIDTSVNSLGYLASYGGTQAIQLVEDSREIITITAKKILSDFEKAYIIKIEIYEHEKFAS
jgi:antirestriction protein ArdC